MAKSLRSKTKRSFRNKKREDGIYAATEAARLNRLNEKLAAAATKDKDGDVPIDAEEGDESLGLCSLLIFGLLDQNDITAEGMEAMAKRCPGQFREECHLQRLVGDLGINRFHVPLETIREPLKEKNDSDFHSETLVTTVRMDLDNTESSMKRISTHGPRGSRNEEWRKSKGLAPRPKSRGMNRQGGIAAKRKAGRSARRR